jgi:hypothetical protein
MHSNSIARRGVTATLGAAALLVALVTTYGTSRADSGPWHQWAAQHWNRGGGNARSGGSGYDNPVRYKNDGSGWQGGSGARGGTRNYYGGGSRSNWGGAPRTYYGGGSRTYGGGGGYGGGSRRYYGGGSPVYYGGGSPVYYGGGSRSYYGGGSCVSPVRYVRSFRAYCPRSYVSFHVGYRAPVYIHDYYYDDQPTVRSYDRAPSREESDIQVDVENEPPAGCEYYDPYCKQQFSTLDEYTDHIDQQDHAKTIQIIERDSGKLVRTLEFVNGEWGVQ